MCFSPSYSSHTLLRFASPIPDPFLLSSSSDITIISSKSSTSTISSQTPTYPFFPCLPFYDPLLVLISTYLFSTLLYWLSIVIFPTIFLSKTLFFSNYSLSILNTFLNFSYDLLAVSIITSILFHSFCALTFIALTNVSNSYFWPVVCRLPPT